MRYYSILRPVSPGTFPKPRDNKVIAIKNFDERTFCAEIKREVWGYLEYEKPLTNEDVISYELIEGDKNK